MESKLNATLRLPKSMNSLFWDCDPQSLSWERNAGFIIRRILDRGSWDAITWLRRSVGDQTIKDWLCAKHGRSLGPRKLRFWALILDIPDADADEWVREAKKSTWFRRGDI